MQIRKATLEDCDAIARLALIAGEGIPAFFWEQARVGNEDIISVGARNAASQTDNFSYRNTLLASVDGATAGMLLAYRLPGPAHTENLDDYPAFIRPLIELELRVPDSYYVNMLAAFPEYRNQGIGTQLMAQLDRLAAEAGCSLASVEVFEENSGALRLYQRLGFSIIDQRDVVPHACHPYTGKLCLLTRSVSV
jgi:ribosomal protein S18 acetylase RimI-like enzyme